MNSEFTIPQRIKALGYEPLPALGWRSGQAMCGWYKEHYGALPRKDLRTKTMGVGSHCLAVYPLDLMPQVDEIVRKTAAEIEAEDSRQLKLF